MAAFSAVPLGGGRRLVGDQRTGVLDRRSGTSWRSRSRSPVGHPLTAGAGLNELGRSAVARSSETVTLGTWGLASSTVPPKLSNSEKPPTMAKSFSTSAWVSCLLGAPAYLSSLLSTMILRPLMPPGGVDVVGVGLGAHRGPLEEPGEQGRDVADRHRVGGDAGVVAEGRRAGWSTWSSDGRCRWPAGWSTSTRPACGRHHQRDQAPPCPAGRPSRPRCRSVAWWRACVLPHGSCQCPADRRSVPPATATSIENLTLENVRRPRPVSRRSAPVRTGARRPPSPPVHGVRTRARSMLTNSPTASTVTTPFWMSCPGCGSAARRVGHPGLEQGRAGRRVGFR